MKVSTKGRYGLKAILDLAVFGTTNHIPLKQIAERQNISERYLEQVFSILRKGGLIKSVKGPQGGYLLACGIKTTVGEILRVLEGNLNFEQKVETGDITEECINAIVWQEIDKSINLTLENITLENLVEAYKTKSEDSAYMFYI